MVFELGFYPSTDWFKLSDSPATASALVLHDTFMHFDLRIRRHTEQGTSLSDFIGEGRRIYKNRKDPFS